MERYFYFTYKYAGKKFEGNGGLTYSDTRFPGAVDLVEQIKDLLSQDLGVTGVDRVVITGWQEMTKEDFDNWIEE